MGFAGKTNSRCSVLSVALVWDDHIIGLVEDPMAKYYQFLLKAERAIHHIHHARIRIKLCEFGKKGRSSVDL